MSPATRDPKRLARAVKAGCEAYGGKRNCLYPICKASCSPMDIAVAAIEAWEAPQRLGDDDGPDYLHLTG